MLGTLVLLGCGQGKDARDADARHGTPILALVAASTSDAVREIADDFSGNTGIEVRLSADDSSKLAAQIANGVPADVFLSANKKWADFIKDKGLSQDIKELLGNTLVLVVPKGNPAKVTRPEDLTVSAVKKVALAGPTVPAGIYARQALSRLHLVDELEKENKIVGGESVRATLTFVERGEVEAGVVYGTDAKITDKVEVASTFSPATHDPIVYPLVLLARSQQNASARQFYEHLASPSAAAVFRRYGFTLLSGN
jgi:molybdate transport system substrate-binding protein